jgi:hypothetical protein
VKLDYWLLRIARQAHSGVRRSASLIVVCAIVLSASVSPSAEAEKARSPYNEGRDQEKRQNYEAAYEAYLRAYDMEPANIRCRAAVARTRYLAASSKVHRARLLRQSGSLKEALDLFAAAAVIDPSSAITLQEVETTRRMIQYSKTHSQKDKPRDLAGLSPDILDAQGPVRLAPVSNLPITVKLSEDTKVVYTTVGKLAGLNVLTALLHHLNIGLLRDSFYALKSQASPGIDGVTWQEYETGLEDRLTDLLGRVHRGVYRAQPSRRVYIPKADGWQRPLGVAALEDKIVQQAVVTILNQIYEVDFKGFSYGFRPGRSPHQALDALAVGIQWKRVNWVLDADIRGFFDNMNHEWTMKFIEHRVADRRILRLIQKWLKAGVSEDGQWSETKLGTPQGAVVSPLLANVYLHHVFDLWVEARRKKMAKGDVIVVR